MSEPTMRRTGGFTLIEVMITVAIVAVLAAIALPSYADYITRSKIIDATSRLGDLKTDMEKYFMDNRSYQNGGNCGVAAKIATMNADPSAAFTIGCVADATTFTLTATGVAAKGMSGFVYTVDQTNAHATTGLPAGWAGSGSACWVTRKDGSC
jgi:type IV pilus assembly protein PilE